MNITRRRLTKVAKKIRKVKNKSALVKQLRQNLNLDDKIKAIRRMIELSRDVAGTVTLPFIWLLVLKVVLHVGDGSRAQSESNPSQYHDLTQIAMNLCIKFSYCSEILARTARFYI